MSLSRTALRLAAYEALAPYGTASGAWPTLAGDNVYDSRLDPIADQDEAAAFLARLDNKPIVILYTEDDDTEPAGDTKHPLREEYVDLVAEILIAALQTMQAEGPNGLETVTSVGVADADAFNEALIDTLEAQVKLNLDVESEFPSNKLYRSIAWEVRQIKSLPDRQADRTTKVARRTVRFRCKIPRDAWPPFAVSPAPTGLACLPWPLRSIALALNSASPSYAICEQIAALIGQPPAATPLTEVELQTQVFKSEAAANLAQPVAPASVADETLVTNVTANAEMGGSENFDPNFDPNFG